MMALASATVMLTSPKDVGPLKYLLLQSIVHLIVILSCSASDAVHLLQCYCCNAIVAVQLAVAHAVVL